MDQERPEQSETQEQEQAPATPAVSVPAGFAIETPAPPEKPTDEAPA